MYEQYTDEQIVEMLIPKMNKCSERTKWDGLIEKPWGNADLFKVLATIYRSAYIRGQLGRSFIIGEKKAKKPVNTFKVGDKVKFLGLNFDDEEALTNRRFFPPVNTVGKVVESGLIYCVVHWPKSTTSGDGVWGCRNSYLKKVTEHWAPATKDNVKVGDKVRYLNAEKHERNPRFYPLQGTIGKVIAVNDGYSYSIQWPGYASAWFASQSDLEVLLCE